MDLASNEHEGDIINLVPAVDRAFKILAVLKGEGAEYSAVEIARELVLNKSTVHKLLMTLAHHGAVQRDESSKRYRLGIALAEYGNVALDNLDIRRTAKPLLKALADFTGETATLATLEGTKVVIIDKKEPPVEIRVSPRVGWHFPATLSAMGKALVAWMPLRRIEEILRREGLPVRTSRSITDPLSYRSELVATRERGYATEFEEFHDGVNGVAAPIFDARGLVIASVGLGGPAFRMTDVKVMEFGPRCVEVAREISRKY